MACHESLIPHLVLEARLALSCLKGLSQGPVVFWGSLVAR